jgi:hypothetical protein
MMISHEDSASRRITLMPNGAAITQLMKEPSNQICADCSSPSPNHVSTTTGAIICGPCSDIHRGLPSDVSNIKCLTVDILPVITVKYLLCLPNSVVNDIYEAKLDYNIKKPTPNASSEERKNWIVEKYQKKRFVDPFGGLRIELHQELVDAIQNQDVPAFMKLVAQGANPEPITCNGIHILHLAIEEGLDIMVEAILQVGVNVDLPDKNDGRTAIFFAIDCGHIEIVKLLINGHNANLQIQSNDGYDPLSYAHAIAQEEPNNPVHHEIYDYIHKKVSTNTNKTESSLSRGPSATMTPQKKPSVQVQSDLLLEMHSMSGPDTADSQASSSDESISLSDYL